ncbi:ATP/GTP-binding protein [Streptomyces roseoverticillatus]|uniref:ATP/GTP-binding protein n=1 Tax=Streptomyces roseoverticillatus TaxID=66429 RepID=UPI0033F1CA0F
MSDETDETGSGTLVRGPWSGDSSYAPPPIPDFADTLPPPDDSPGTPPESPDEATMQLPPIPAPPDPAVALHSDGTTAPEDWEDDAEYEEGEYVQPRSLADRLGDWLEYRIEMARARYESEAPFREAEIARKAALLEARTAQDVAMMEQNGKLHAAMMKAKGDKAAARGKAGADRMKSPGSGLGADKGRSKAGGGGGSSRGGGGSSPSRSNSGPGPNRPASSRGGANTGGSSGRSGSGSAGSGGGKGGTKGPDRASGSRTAGSGRNGSSGGSKGSQTGSGGSGRNSGGSKGGGGPSHRGPAGSPRAERSRGRQERAGARQAARQERRSAGHAAGLDDRSKARDQARANRQKDWEDRRAKKAERQAARKAKREAASAGQGRTTLGAAVAEEAQRRWDKRRANANTTADKTNQPKGKKGPKEPPGGASSAGKGSAAPDEQSKASKARGGASGGSGKAQRGRRSRRRRARRAGRNSRWGRTRRRGRTGWRWSSDSLFGTDDSAITVEWLDHPTRPPRTADGGEDDIEDAVIVEDDPASAATRAKGLPRAPEPHTQRPGTTRDISTEGSTVSTDVTTPSGLGGGLAAQHRTDITFDEYLVEMANIAIQSASHQERIEALKDALGRVADALRDMAADLVDDHNIDIRVTGQITDVADAAGDMKIQAERCAEQCDMANEAARLGAVMVARVYGQDMDAKEDADLKHTSAAAHHD